MLKNILEYFEKTVSLFPEKRAVADKTESYTFIQLKNAAACIADAINSCGRDVRCVAVFADRAALTLAMFLGVLYSGKHYIPLDPSMPSEKMKKILADIQDGTFAKDFLLDMSPAGRQVHFKAMRKIAAEHPVEKVGEEVRSLYSWNNEEDKFINN